jgi:hypothetical protein
VDQIGFGFDLLKPKTIKSYDTFFEDLFKNSKYECEIIKKSPHAYIRNAYDYEIKIFEKKDI